MASIAFIVVFGILTVAHLWKLFRYRIGICIPFVVGYAMGSEGYLLGHEWPRYVFDASLMTLTRTWFFLRYLSELKVAMEEDSHEMEQYTRREESNAMA